MQKIYLVQKMVSRLILGVFRKWAEASGQKADAKVPVQEFLLAGYQYHRAEGVWPFLQIGEALRLKREPYNQYDPGAIAVYFKNDMLGYIPGNENGLLSQMMDDGEILEAVITQLLTGSKSRRSVKFMVFLGSKRSICPIKHYKRSGNELESNHYGHISCQLLRYDGPK